MCYCNINIEMRRDRAAGTIACAMKGYIDKVIARFDNWAGTRSAKSPGIYQSPSYGTKQQFTAPEDHSKPLSPADVNTLQQLIGSVLYYTRAIDSPVSTCTKPTNLIPDKPLQPREYYYKHNAHSNTYAPTTNPNSSFANQKWG